MHIGATEAMPNVYRNANTLRERVLCMLLFVVGAVLIGSEPMLKARLAPCQARPFTSG